MNISQSHIIISYLELLFLLKDNILADGGRRDDEAEHDDEWKLALEHVQELVVVVRWIGKALETNAHTAN